MKKIDTIVISMGGQGKRIRQDLKKRGIDTSKVFLKVYGKPILSHLIDMAIELNFRHIFLLASHYEPDLNLYLKENYKNNKKIIPIYGGKMGRKWGVPWLINSIKIKLQKPFIYSDGNILYRPSILKKLMQGGCKKETLVKVALSDNDCAPTHSRLIVNRGRVNAVITRLKPNQKKQYIGRQYYSLGLMTLNNMVFSLTPQFLHRKDLDYIVEDAHRYKKESVQAVIYRGKWAAVHTIADIDKLQIR